MRRKREIQQIKLSEIQREKLNDEIKAFYYDVRGEEIGVIQQMQLLELFEEKLAPIVYKEVVYADDGQSGFGLLWIV